MKPPVIYCIENTVNGKVYVGSSTRGFNTRSNEHLRDLKKGIHYNKLLQRAWNKYGECNFRIFILEVVPDITGILDKEREWILGLRATDRSHGYNHCNFGTNRVGAKNTPEQNAKIGASNRGKKRTPEQIAKLSAVNRGRKRGPRPPEVKEKIAAKQRGIKRRPLTEEHKAKISRTNKGRCFTPREFLTDEHKAAISKALTGKKRKPFSPEHRARISEAAKRQWEAIKATGHPGRSVPLC